MSLRVEVEISLRGRLLSLVGGIPLVGGFAIDLVYGFPLREELLVFGRLRSLFDVANRVVPSQRKYRLFLGFHCLRNQSRRRTRRSWLLLCFLQRWRRGVLPSESLHRISFQIMLLGQHLKIKHSRSFILYDIVISPSTFGASWRR